MSRKKFAFILLVLVLIFAVVFYVQTRRYAPPDQMAELGVADQLVSAGTLQDGIPSIDDPQFESVAAADEYLKDDGEGLLVQVDGDARFYPYQILVWHEIVNDSFNKKPLAITVCPLCYAGVAFEREHDGEVLLFGTSGKLFDNNLVMYDRATKTLWRQLDGKAIIGEREGSELVKFPSVVMQWKDVKKQFPRAEILSRETGATRDYTRDPYAGYYGSPQIWFPLSHVDDRLSGKSYVYGVRDDQKTIAYTKAAFEALVEKSDNALFTFWFCWAARYPETEIVGL